LHPNLAAIAACVLATSKNIASRIMSL
jgi:hypothetical protein